MIIIVPRKFQNQKFHILTSTKAQISSSISSSWSLPRPPRHPFHIVTLSPWPLSIGGFTLGIAGGLASWLHGHSIDLIMLRTLGLTIAAKNWWRDIVIEGTYQGFHTKKVTRGFYWGIGLLILSEVLFFFRFFWAFLHRALAPTPEIACQWPPLGIRPVNPITWPLFNSIILLTRGALANLAYLYLIIGKLSKATDALNGAILAGILFSRIQGYEYYHAPFTIADSIFGSAFYILTGFHGLHVLVGTIILQVQKKRLQYLHFSPKHHVGFLAAIWYWHFVDLVWLILFALVYIWGTANIVDIWDSINSLS
jgi:cytochrome c oxidase subunit 3